MNKCIQQDKYMYVQYPNCFNEIKEVLVEDLKYRLELLNLE